MTALDADDLESGTPPPCDERRIPVPAPAVRSATSAFFVNGSLILTVGGLTASLRANLGIVPRRWRAHPSVTVDPRLGSMFPHDLPQRVLGYMFAGE